MKETALCIRWPKYWRFGLSISASNEYSGLISFRIDWFGLFAVQATFKVFSSTTIQSINSSALSLLYAPISHPYMTTGKVIALTIWTFVGKMMSLLFNTLSRLVIAFLPRSKCLLIPWLQPPSAVILEPKKIKSPTVFIFSPPICQEVMEPDAIILVFWVLSFKQVFHSPLSPSSRLFSSSSLSAIRVVSSTYLDSSPSNLDSSL